MVLQMDVKWVKWLEGLWAAAKVGWMVDNLVYHWVVMSVLYSVDLRARRWAACLVQRMAVALAASKELILVENSADWKVD